LTTHNGLIAIAVPERANATLTVRTYNGGFRSSFPLKLDDQNPRKRFTLALGNGSAHLELESFGGTIALRRPGEPRPETERKRQRERDKDHAALDLSLHGGLLAAHPAIDLDIQTAMRDVQPAIDAAMREVQPAVDAAMREVQPGIETALREIQPGIDAAMREIQPEIDAAMAEVMAALEQIQPLPRMRPMPMPSPRPLPRPRIR